MKKIVLAALLMGLIALIGGGGVGLYIWYMPHRDVLAAQPDYTLPSSSFISEYLANLHVDNYLNDKSKELAGGQKVDAAFTFEGADTVKISLDGTGLATTQTIQTRFLIQPYSEDAKPVLTVY